MDALHMTWNFVRRAAGRRAGSRPLAALCLASVIWGVGRVASAGVEATETWSGVDTAGWSNETAGAGLSNPGGYLEFQFKEQTAPAMVEDRAWVEMPSGGTVVLTNLSFRFWAGSTYPSALRVVLHASANGQTWELHLARPTVGPWQAYSVPIAYTSGWFRSDGGESAETFAQDLRLVDRVAVYVRRHGSPVVQPYGIDDFTLQGLAIDLLDRDGDGIPDAWETLNAFDPDDPTDAGDDADGDTMTNYAEYRAGTDPNDPDSLLVLRIESETEFPGEPVEGVILHWHSISNRTYAVWRTLDLRGDTREQLDSGVPATPPVNAYLAPVDTNVASAFYRIEVEEP